MFSEDFIQLMKRKTFHNGQRTFTVLSWVGGATVIGLMVGFVASIFGLAMSYLISVRQAHKWILCFLPVGAVAIVFLYQHILKKKDTGTNTVISAIQSDSDLPFSLAPLIFISTLLTHLVGGSAGREGAALQLGGAMANKVGTLFNFNDSDRKTLIMCGMSAAFSALFGTPMAAAIFSMEVVSVGIMHYAALVPCVISSLVARSVAESLGLTEPSYIIDVIPKFTVNNAILISLFAVVCGLVSIVFCMMLHQFEEHYSLWLPNPYARAMIGGTLVLLLTILVGNSNYNSTGTDVILSCFNGADIGLEVFILKMIFTTITLSSGYKGGEIVPTLYIGATLGCAIGGLIGFSPALLAAVGMGSLFCGVTNCPITSLLICFELFGYDAMPYYLLATAFSYWVSGYHGLYKSQKIVYSKYWSNYIDKHVK